MRKTAELLEEVRAILGGVTDYKLAQKLEIDRKTISRFLKGIQNADTYAAARIALVLGRDPLEVIAEIESEAASTETKRSFWKSFRSGLAHTTFGGVLLLTGSFSAPGQTGMANADSGAGSNPVRIMYIM